MAETSITPYLMFAGRTEEAIEFYRSALGAEVEMLMRFSESPEPPPEGMLPPGYENKVMHASILIQGERVMMSDGCGEEQKFGGFSLAMAVETEEDARKAFDALAEGGTVQMPLTKTFWSPAYGMLLDRFGVHWMVMVRQDEL